jgi:anti-sigma factor RsiW
MSDCEAFEAQWTDYLDDALPMRDRKAMNAHLSGCVECRTQLSLFEQIDRRLRLECGAVLQSINESGEIGAPPVEKILAALRDGAAIVNPEGQHERLWRVRWVLALLCGTNTAANIIAVAESHASVRVNPNPGEQKWLAFLRRLSVLTSEICGNAAGELIWAVGK